MYKLKRAELDYRAERRGVYIPEQCWYALAVHTGKEQNISDWIYDTYEPHLGISTYLPYILSRSRQASPRLLFPSYVFINCKMTDDVYIPLADHRFVYEILGEAYRIPSPLPENEVETLINIVNNGGRPQLISTNYVGSEAEVVEGVLRGTKGRIIYVNEHEAKISVNMSFLDIGTSLSVIVPASYICIKGNAQSSDREKILYA